MYHVMFSRVAGIEEASLRVHCTQLLKQALSLSSCANADASATGVSSAANASTSEEDDSEF